jgi:hypothetical protein
MESTGRSVGEINTHQIIMNGKYGSEEGKIIFNSSKTGGKGTIEFRNHESDNVHNEWKIHNSGQNLNITYNKNSENPNECFEVDTFNQTDVSVDNTHVKVDTKLYLNDLNIPRFFLQSMPLRQEIDTKKLCTRTETPENYEVTGDPVVIDFYKLLNLDIVNFHSLTETTENHYGILPAQLFALGMYDCLYFDSDSNVKGVNYEGLILYIIACIKATLPPPPEILLSRKINEKTKDLVIIEDEKK